jgi:biotin operon repressor BirA-like protein
MVNPNLLTLYNRLKNTTDPLPGGKIGEEMGVSKVAVWKMIGKLQDLGVQIIRSNKGYRLQERDPLHPYSFPGWQDRVHYCLETQSTMALARELAQKQSWGHVVVAEQQSGAVSRSGESWSSPPGGLYLTAVTRPESGSVLDIVPRGLRFLLALVQEGRERWGLDLKVCWPGDLIAQGRKVGGILIEAAGSNSQWQYCNLGLGLRLEEIPVLGQDGLGSGPGRHEVLQLILSLIDQLQKWDRKSIDYPQREYSGMSLFEHQDKTYQMIGIGPLGALTGKHQDKIRSFHPSENQSIHFKE